jgi:polyisoprenoid-binding protein YceI
MSAQDRKRSMNMRRLSSLTALLALAAGAAHAQTVDPTASELVFVTRQMGVPVEGRFQRWSAQVALDPRKPEAGHVVMHIQMDSVSFAAPEVTAEAQRAVWLDTARYPQATFQSSRIRAAGEGRYELSGQLTLKGESHDLVVPVTLTQNGAKAVATGNFTVKRNDYRVGEGEWTDASLVAHEVQVRFRLALSGLPTP